MSSATLRSRSAGDTAADRSPGIGRWLAAAAVLAVVGLATAWLLGWFGAAVDPRVAEIRQLREELAAKYPNGAGPTNLVEATAMVAAMNGIRQKIEALPEQLRPQAEQGGGSMFRTAMRARIDAYFNAPPAQRDAVLDRQIDEMEFMNKAFETARAVTAVVGGTASGSTPGGSWRSTSEEERNKFRKGIIDRTSPAERARYVEYWRAMAERREKRGMAPSPWGR